MHLSGGVSDQKRTVGRVPQLLVHLLPKTAKTDSASLSTSCMSSHGVCVCYLEMSPQYHSASCRTMLLLKLVEGAGAEDFTGLGGKAETESEEEESHPETEQLSF